MSRETIQDAQSYLILMSENRVKRILDVETLLKRHPAEEVIAFLQEIYSEKERFLKIMIGVDKTSSKINEVIATMFRIHMAIRILESGGKEVMIHNERIESRAESSCGVS